jgi:hypothetical protein
MKKTLSQLLETARLRDGAYASRTGDQHGAFKLIAPSRRLAVLSSGPNEGWEHVSVSAHDRTPTWKEMCWIKDLFWDDDEVVMQLHPAKRDYVNHHPYCLHLWRPLEGVIPLPPSEFVGPKETA